MHPEDFAEVYRAHYPTVLKFLRHRTSDAWLAEDIASETFLRAWKAIDRFEPYDGGMVAWLQRIARNILFDHGRSGSVRHELQSAHPCGEPGVAFEVPTRDLGPEELVVRMEEHAEVDRLFSDLRLAILRLTEDQAEVMLYRHIDGLSVKETAEATGKAEGAVKSLCFRAVPHLVEQLEGVR
jgi:RNA polymerase sigma-70 factor (ECF subfamily)